MPSHWETSVVSISGGTHIQLNSNSFLRSICSRYEVHYFSLTMLLVSVEVVQCVLRDVVGDAH